MNVLNWIRFKLTLMKERLYVLLVMVKTGDIFYMSHMVFILTANFLSVKDVYNSVLKDDSKISDWVEYYVIEKSVQRSILVLFRREPSLCYRLTTLRDRINLTMLDEECNRLNFIIGIDVLLTLLLMSDDLEDELIRLLTMSEYAFICECNALGSVEL